MSTDPVTRADDAGAPEAAQQPGERLLAGRYRVGPLIGRGGMAEVHAGVDTRLNRTVAIKLLRSSLANDPAFRLRFRQEAQAASRMTDPSIVRVFDAGEETVLESGGGEAQLPFIVMEFVDGHLLKDRLAEGPMTPAEAGHVVLGILTALEYSHRAGVVHRDIKPGNVMVTRTGQVKVMDFGIARAISDSSATVAQTSAILGTAQYFSPEQAKGETVDARSDLYSTGIVLYEMLTGRAPFRADTPVAVAYQHVSEAPEVPSDIEPSISEHLDAVVLRSIEKRKDARYQSAAAFRDDVEAVLAGRKPVARLPKADTMTEFFGGAAPTADAAIRQIGLDDPGRVRTSTRPPVAWVWGGVAVVVVVVLAVAIWILGVIGGGFGGTSVPAGLAGTSQSRAEAALRTQQLQPRIRSEPDASVSKGVVLRTVPGPSTSVPRHTTVTVWVSSGPQKVVVPPLDGLVLSAATAAIKNAKLTPGGLSTAHSPTAADGVVLSASVPSGRAVAEFTQIDLVVSDGQVALPNLLGESVTDATAALNAAGLVPDPETKGDCGSANQTVIEQSSPAGSVPQGSVVTITTCDGS